MDQWVRITVRCYAGYQADEKPTSFLLEGNRFDVVEILERWYDLDSSCFKVLTESGTVYLLRHDLNTDHWELSERIT